MNYARKQMKIADQLEAFKAFNSIDNIDAIDLENIYFSHDGCDVCHSGGADVYDCHGYSSKHKKIFDGFQVCHYCLCVEANGIN